MKHKKQLRKVNDDTTVSGTDKPTDNKANKSQTTGKFETNSFRIYSTLIFYYTSDYPVDFSSKNSVCGGSDAGIQESKNLARPNRSLNNDDERSQRYDLSEVSEVDDDDEVDGAGDEIIDIVGDHSHIMMNNVQRNYEQQRFF